MEISNIQEVFCNHYVELSEEMILEMNKSFNSGELNNVVVGLNKQCFGLSLVEDREVVKYQLFYVRAEDRLVGDLIQLSADVGYRDELVFYFSKFLAHNYKDIDLINTFNTFQSQTRSMLEKLGFLTISSTELDAYDDPNPLVLAKDVRGLVPIRLIRKVEFYKVFFGKVYLPDVEGEYVYLMLNKRNDYIKIGKSRRPVFREKTLQADEPDIELIAYWEAPGNIERELHKKFASKRQRGEWFNLDLKDMKYIKELMHTYMKTNEN